MKKIFKHIWNSLSKNKVILIGISILVFLTTGIFTLLFTINKSYQSKINDYRQVSGIQDATVDLDLNFFGNAKDNGFDTEKDDVYKVYNSPATEVNKFVIGQSYVKLADLIGSNKKDSNFYISSARLLQEYKLFQNNKDFATNFFFNIDSDKKTFRVSNLKTDNEYFLKYTQNNNDFQPVKKTYKVTDPNHVFKLDRDYLINEIILFDQNSNPKQNIISVSNLYLNLITNEASFDAAKILEWKKLNIAYEVPQSEVLKLLSLKKENEQKIPDFASKSNKKILDINDLAQAKTYSTSNYSEPYKYYSYNDKLKINHDTIVQLDSYNNVELSSYDYFIFPKREDFNLKPEWFYTTKIEVSYVNHKWKLKDINKNNFSGAFLSYLEDLQKQPLEFSKIENLNYWEKVTTTTVNGKKLEFKSKLIPQDLTVLIQKGQDKPTSIAEIEHLGNENNIRLLSEQEISELSNPNVRDLAFLKIKSNVEIFSKQFILNYLKTYKQKIENQEKNVVTGIGQREYLTTNFSTTDPVTKKQKNQVAQFINAGISPNFFSENQRQDVGRLFEEYKNFTEHKTSRLYLPKDNLLTSTSVIEPFYVASIISTIFQGNAVDKNYIDVDTTFEDVKFLNKDLVDDVHPQTKIVRLQKVFSNEQTNKEYGSISLGGNTFGVVTKLNTEHTWVFDPDLTFDSLVKFSKYLEDNNLTLKGKIGPNGWLKIHPRFSNSYNVPLILYAPSSAVINELQATRTANILFNQLKDVFATSELIEKNFLIKSDVDAIIDSFISAFEQTGLFQLFLGTNSNPDLFSKFIVYSLSNATTNVRPTIINDLLGSMIDKFIDILEHQPVDKRSEYVIQQIYNLQPIFKNLGLNSFSEFLDSVQPKQLETLILDPIEILKGLKTIVYSFDFDTAFREMRKWYEENSNKLDSDGFYKTVGIANIINPILKSVDTEFLKKGLSQIVSQINFEAIFSTDTDTETGLYKGILVNKIIKNFSQELQPVILNIFKKLNGAGPNQAPYSNITQGLVEFFNFFDLKEFTKNLEKTTYSFKTDIDLYSAESKKMETKHFKSDSLKLSDVIASFVLTLAKDKQSQNQLIEILIKAFNLSGATTITYGINSPANDDKKLTLDEIQSLSDIVSLNRPAYVKTTSKILINKIEQVLDINKLNNALSKQNLNNNVQLDANNFTLSNKAFDIDSLSLTTPLKDFLVNYFDIKKLDNTNLINVYLRLKSIAKIYSLLEISAYTKTDDNKLVNINNSKHPLISWNLYQKSLTDPNLKSKINPEDVGVYLKYLNSIGDVVYDTASSVDSYEKYTNSKFNAEQSSKYLFVSTIYKQALASSILTPFEKDPDSLVKEGLSNFGFWIRMITENPQLSNEELKQAFKILYDLALDKNSFLYKDSSIASFDLDANVENVSTRGLIIGQMSQLWKGILQPFNVSFELFKEDKDKFASEGLRKLFASNLFKKEDKFHNSLAKWIINNKFAFVENLALIGYSKSESLLLKAHYKNVDYVVNDILLKNNDLNYFDKQVLNKLYHQATTSNLSQYLRGLNLGLLVINPYFRSRFPQASLWFATNTKQVYEQINSEGTKANSNLAWVLRNSLPKYYFFKDKYPNDYISKVSQMFSPTNTFVGDNQKPLVDFNSSQVKGVSLDYSYINWVSNKVLISTDQKPVEFFELNFKNFFDRLVSNLFVIRDFVNLVVAYDNRSFVAKVNQSYLDANHKAIYDKALPTSTAKIQELIKTLDQKYILDINGLQFIIVGTDSTGDYLYPLLDENNLQIDAQNQALVFVNKYGFDKVRESNRSSVIKKSLLVKLDPQTNMEQFKADTNKFLSQNFSQTDIKKTYSINDFDFLNPERSLRLSTALGFVNNLSNINLYLTFFLSVLVLFAVVFIVKKYVNNNHKVLGILRAQGYSLFEIATSFTSISIATSIIGGLFGYVLGIALRKPMLNLLQQFWEFNTDFTFFEPISFVISLFIPFVLLTITIYISVVWILRRKPNQLLSGITELNTSKFAIFLSRKLRNKNITTKFSFSLIINSFWKLFSLMISVVLVSFVLIFALSSRNIFQNSVQNTWKNRFYNFRINLFTPSKEGGPIVPYELAHLDNQLYVPEGFEGEVDLEDTKYFQPGHALIKGSHKANGETIPYAPQVLTRSSLNIKSSSQNNGTIFDIVVNNLPESLKNNILTISDKAFTSLEKTQDLKTEIRNGAEFTYKGKAPNYEPYFKYIEDKDNPKASRFWYFVYNPQEQAYDSEEVTLKSKSRDEYRKFLIEGYKKIDRDFSISFGGILFNPQKDELFSYIDTEFKSESGLKIYGYDKDSKFVKIENNKGENVLNILENYEKQSTNSNVYPLAANWVFLQKHHLKVGSEIELPIFNTITRYQDKFNNKPTKTAKFKIVAISNTFINSELISTRDVVNKLTQMDEFNPILKNFGFKAFNGLMSTNKQPEQITSSIGLYSPSGYWAGTDSIDVNGISNEIAARFFREIFAYSDNASDTTTKQGLLQKQGFTKDDLYRLIYQNQDSKDALKEKISLNFKQLEDEEYFDKYNIVIRNGLKNFNSLFSDNLYQIETQAISAKDIETNFINNFASLFSSATSMIVVIFLIVSVIILVVMASTIIAENEKNIAILSVLGYSTLQKVKLFFTVYIPIVLIGFLVSIPLVYAFISLFNNYIISTSSIVLAISFSALNLFITLAIILVVFAITLTFAWWLLNRKKSVYILKEE
ncbi:FtsX-like permease family protein [Mesomycoplasma hyorhinis]|uniref:FtsX-like permease family protein n=1 Tax=Mesomycoplasma hyorhinis TaxID=2100 RepID=UPI001C05EAE1|nr:FtsX-like permease family protein [Mesomycoplasma hyorhinis]